MSILLHIYIYIYIYIYIKITWTLTKCMEKNLESNYTGMLQAVLNKSWRQHPTKLQLYDHLPPIPKTIQVRRTRHAQEVTTSSHMMRSSRPFHIDEKRQDNQLEPIFNSSVQILEDLPGAIDERDEWRERVKRIHVSSATWWWWWFPWGSKYGTSVVRSCCVVVRKRYTLK